LTLLDLHSVRMASSGELCPDPLLMSEDRTDMLSSEVARSECQLENSRGCRPYMLPGKGVGLTWHWLCASVCLARLGACASEEVRYGCPSHRWISNMRWWKRTHLSTQPLMV